MKYLIAYDIADEKRLRRVAKYFEQFAQRVQRSVFVYNGTPEQIDNIIRDSLAEIDPHEDVVQSWPIAATTSVGRFDHGKAIDPYGWCVIVSQEGVLLLKDVPCSDS